MGQNEDERVEDLPLPAHMGPREVAETAFRMVGNLRCPVKVIFDERTALIVRPESVLEQVIVEIECLWPRERTLEEFAELVLRRAQVWGISFDLPADEITVRPDQTYEEVLTALLRKKQDREHPKL
ncbi:hypothetical protein [Actinomadura sp. WMMA1423]|uniref:hypothetical protein n=1 Tax=Actinomadura sp. WMMA1423 TaxID=2591108 RepID=UPI0011471BDC|nr:hypothetical protein [Actinomadura sp. WMMA1423]